LGVLVWKRDQVVCLHFHFAAGDTPLGGVKVDLGPFRSPQLARAHEH
jgi:hypothetical protein